MDKGADLVVTGSAVWVGDGTVTDAIAVRDGLVVALGTDPVSAQVRPGTRRVHAAGELVVPGF